MCEPDPSESDPSGEALTANKPVAVVLIVIVALAVYANSFRGPFIFDDEQSILQNPSIRRLWPIWGPLNPPKGGWPVQSRPIMNLSLALNYALFGLDVRGYHGFNLTIHVLGALLLYGIVRRTLSLPALRDRFGKVAAQLALAAALIWTVHPLQTESVTYVIQRTESIMGLFYLLTLYCVIRGACSARPVGWCLSAVVACALGMASKEVMVTAPVIVLLYDRSFLARSQGVA